MQYKYISNFEKKIIIFLSLCRRFYVPLKTKTSEGIRNGSGILLFFVDVRMAF